MRETPTVTVSAIAAKLNISERAVKKNIAKLKELGILARVGAILDLYVHPQMEQKRLCVELLARNCKQKWTF
jgi:DNA-binding Lrp family transcriptional regulator